MEIERPFYLNRLLRLKDNGRIKIITGMRRAGKSYLLFTLFRKNLLQKGVPEDCVISISLDELANARERNPVELDRWIRSRLKKDGRRYYIFIDEIQFVESIPNPYLPSTEITFVDVVMGLMKLPYVDIYITGSNSRMLSSEVLTQFRDRGMRCGYILCPMRNFCPCGRGISALRSMRTAPMAVCRWCSRFRLMRRRAGI